MTEAPQLYRQRAESEAKNVPFLRSLSSSGRKTEGILPGVSARFRKFLAVLISAAVLLGGSGFSGAFANALDHDLGIETQLGDAARDTGSEGETCSHGCGAHLAAHLVVMTDGGPAMVLVPAGVQRAVLPLAVFLVSRNDSFFRPPRYSLA